MALDTKQSGARGGEWHIITPEEEIRALEAKLAEKKREHAVAGGARSEMGTPEQKEKEMFREVVREHIERSGADIATRSFPTNGTADIAQKMSAPLDTSDREQKLAALVEHALTHTIEGAVSRAEKETPYLIDELHDRLADKYYEKLVQLRKLEAL